MAAACLEVLPPLPLLALLLLPKGDVRPCWAAEKGDGALGGCCADLAELPGLRAFSEGDRGFATRPPVLTAGDTDAAGDCCCVTRPPVLRAGDTDTAGETEAAANGDASFQGPVAAACACAGMAAACCGLVLACAAAKGDTGPLDAAGAPLDAACCAVGCCAAAKGDCMRLGAGWLLLPAPAGAADATVLADAAAAAANGEYRRCGPVATAGDALALLLLVEAAAWRSDAADSAAVAAAALSTAA